VEIIKLKRKSKMIEVGKNYYIIAHAYHHYLLTATEVTPRSVSFDWALKIHSCQRNWTKFFAEGLGSDTKFDIMPAGTVSYDLGYFLWEHPLVKPNKT